MDFLDKFRKNKKSESGRGPKADTVTPGGSPIYRYGESEERDLRSPEAYCVYTEEITAHFEALFPDRESFVFHEIVSDLVHIDVNVMRPTPEQDFYVVYTTGMSDLPMTLPDALADREDLKYAEVFLFLPGDWELGQTGQTGRDIPPRYFWPIRMLKFLARFPHEYKTWLGFGHTIPNGPNYAPLSENVGFGGMVLSWSGDDLGEMEAEDGQKIRFYFVIPAYQEEIEYKLKYGMEALDRRFREGALPMILDIHRPNLCADFTEVLDG